MFVFIPMLNYDDYSNGLPDFELLIHQKEKIALSLSSFPSSSDGKACLNSTFGGYLLIFMCLFLFR